MDGRERYELMVESSIVTMPFSKFHQMAEKELGIPIWTHEFALSDLNLNLKIAILVRKEGFQYSLERQMSPLQTLLGADLR
jgi:hypothetical protein